ncbi:40S ribosomal protein mrp2, mitochondrial [Hanseniaspora osmophila]|uniref:37S ribosomal protein MRP2, mitochondrial n=1 Tax=Hanseniaspora osmophila TaxID=56408 RepID=A0A1E5R500_9ASCO|nr:37S ribosomal protein MRP2, mitochondrial [Hanseniaspora osmophila]
MSSKINYLRLPPLFVKAGIIKDNYVRHAFAKTEVTQQALKHIARNTTLPTKVRLQAQLQLASMPNYTKFTQVKNRCVESGHARGVISKFGLNRYVFRQKALAGELPGVKKGVW